MDLCLWVLIILLLIYLLYLNVKNSMTNEFNWELDKKGRMKIYDKCKFKHKGVKTLNHEIGECSVAMQVITVGKECSGNRGWMG